MTKADMKNLIAKWTRIQKNSEWNAQQAANTGQHQALAEKSRGIAQGLKIAIDDLKAEVGERAVPQYACSRGVPGCLGDESGKRHVGAGHRNSY